MNHILKHATGRRVRRPALTPPSLASMPDSVPVGIAALVSAICAAILPLIPAQRFEGVAGLLAAATKIRNSNSEIRTSPPESGSGAGPLPSPPAMADQAAAQIAPAMAENPSSSLDGSRTNTPPARSRMP